MENDEDNNISATGTFAEDNNSQCAVNSLILDYYKKFGRKRDLEQFFSLSTAQGEIQDTSGLFWRNMKSENDSSDSGGRKSDTSAQELCRISIRCSMPEGSSSQSEEHPRTKPESPHTESPPIITEDVPADISRQTDDESFKSDDNHSQKSFDPLLDLSTHKPLSPSSSITSQRKLEWDSLADVGYANESDRKTSASSLSTLERLALKQQYSNNDTNQEIGNPTCHSTPVEENEVKSKMKKNNARKVTKIVKKDVDFVEVNVPHTSYVNPRQSINVNLTKHISFNLEKDGGISFGNMRKDVNVSPEKVTIEEISSLPMHKEIQTSLPKTKDKSCSSVEEQRPVDLNALKIPVMISLNTLRKRLRRRKTRVVKRRQKTKKKMEMRKDVPQEKSGEQLSEAESFEYMPGHIYHQNQMKANENNEPRSDHNNTAGNKSSLESSGGLTTDSSKGSKHSLTQDLEKCIKVLKVTLQKRYDDSETKTKLIKDIVQRLLSSKYRDDDTSTDFLSGLSFNSKKLDLKENNTTSSTSDANNTDDSKEKRPRKSILRMEHFDSNNVASTSQSAPNLFTATSTEKIFTKSHKVVTSYSESDESSKGKTSSDNAPPKTSSEQLYLKYLEALRREESYKRHLRDKEMFLKQKLGNSDAALKAPNRQEVKINNRLKDLMKDLTRNNYDDGSGDASKLEGGSTSDRNAERCTVGSRSQRSHSVFTLSSSQSEGLKKPNLKKKMQVERDLDAGTSKNHYCCCPHHFVDSKAAYADSSVQVNIKYQCENETNAKPKQDQSAKCPNCENSQYSTRDEKCKCNEMPKLNPKAIGTFCSKCGKLRRNSIADNETYITYQKYSRSPRTARMIPNKNDDRNSFCVCNDNPMQWSNMGDYPTNQLPNRGIRFGDPSNIPNSSTQCEGSCKSSEDDGIQFLRAPKTDLGTDSSKSDNTSKARKCSQSSQTNMSINLMVSEKSTGSKPKNPVIIHEATRCLQTEISIDPQISDPTLSNIVIVSNCVELIGEQHREVNETNTKNPEEIKTFSDMYTSSESGKFLLRSGPSTFEPETGSDINPSGCKDCQIEPTKKPNDYAIPIEGTNMTLVVSLAAKDIYKKIEQENQAVGTVTLASKDNNGRKEQVNQAVGTEKLPFADQGTCIAIECAKSAQCQPTTSANSTRSTGFDSEHNSNKGGMSGEPLRKSSLSKPGTSGSPKRNTYPKKLMRMKLQPNERKSFQRSNTDTGKLETYSEGFQTEPLNTIDFGDLVKQSNFETETIEHSCQIPDTNSDKLMLRSGSDDEEEKVLFNTREIGIQKDLPESEVPGRKPTPEMMSKSVGSDIKTATNDRAVDCQADVQESIGDGISKRACTKCGCGNESDCQCDKVLESRSRKTTCENCENGDACGRNVCGCKCEKFKDGSPRKTKCVVCACDTCQCKEKQILREIVSKKSICGKCGCEDSCQCDSDSNGIKDPIIDMIKDITKRYSKNEITKIKKKKCFTEIITVLNYLLETDDSTDQEPRRVSITPEFSENYDKKSARSKSPISDDKNAKTYPQSSKSTIDKNANIRYHQSPGSPKRSPRITKKCLRSKSPICCDKSKKILSLSENESCSCKYSKHSALPPKCTNKDCTESSDLPCSTDIPSTSDSTACKILRKIKRECEKYHLRRTKCGRKCEISSSTSVNCDQCKKVHHCGCRHKCKRSKTVEKLQKKCVAYNLILQTSESMLSEGPICDKSRPLKNVVVKVPKSKDKFRAEMCKETLYKAEKGHKNHSSPRGQRSKSCPKESELSSTDDFIRRMHHCTIREYLEKNRPDFVEKCSERQSCLKYINEMRPQDSGSPRLKMLVVHRPTCMGSQGNHDCCGGPPICYNPCDPYAPCHPDPCSQCNESYNILTTNEITRIDERAAHRDMLSLYVLREPDLTSLSTEQLRDLAQQIGLDMRRKKIAPKFISEREMKKHSKNIYKTLPEVVQKKEEKKKENIKKTNLLMANIFKKNLQKNTLRGTVNLSNYNSVIKI